jgi:hypothetical protein
MSNPSNLYAEKVFSEHPVALWALDDTVDYVSLISEEQRNFSNWTISNGTNTNATDILNEPFINSFTNKITANKNLDKSNILCVGPDIFNFRSLSSSLGTFAVSAYINSLTPYITGLDIGYEYYDSTTGTKIQNIKHYDTSIYNKWLFISETFHTPIDNTTMRPIINIHYFNNPENIDDYSFLVNGISVGQWSEEFHAFSLGVSPIEISNDINLNLSFGIEAKAYGLQDKSGYYLSNQNSLCAKNSGIPMVYGAGNTTIITSNNNIDPSLIIPGQGFLNELGKFKDYTLEMWLKIDSPSVDLKKIFGPISSTDGIYANREFLMLKINENSQSFYVGEWSRPMLIHIRISKNTASLLVNGEEVISLNFISENLFFPNKFTQGKDNDWLGFYCYDDMNHIEIDCVGIYPYKVPVIVAKKRFIYGQGVEIPENINRAFSGSSVFIDYPFSKYSNNYNYPDIGKWSKGILNNLGIENNSIVIPKHKLPNFVSDNKTIDSFYLDNKIIQNEFDLFFTFKPNNSWSDTNAYLIFDNINLVNDYTKSIHGIFKYVTKKTTTQTLIRIEDQFTGDYFSIDLIDGVVYYRIKMNDEILPKELYQTDGILPGDKFAVGLNILDFSNYFGGNVAKFFGNRSSLKVYIAGTKNFENTFRGKVYSINFNNDFNFNKISYLFDERGFPKEYANVFNQYNIQTDFDSGDSYFGNGGSFYDENGNFVTFLKEFWDYYIDGGLPQTFSTDRLSSHRSTYSLVPSTYFDKFELDINISGFWEDNLPLTYFAKYTKDLKNNKKYGLDFLQFNINYPSPDKYSETSTYSNWKYQDLKLNYESPIQRTYESLDNHLFTGYNDYSDLALNAKKVYNFDTSRSLVKTYITFQYTKDGANSNINSYLYTVKPQLEGTVLPGSYQVGVEGITPIYDSFINTKYEVVDNTIIYPPNGIDFNDLSIVVHFEVNVDKISKNPIVIKSLQLASQSFNYTKNEIGTRFGNPIYPYTKRGIYYDYKSKNPFSIYKGSTPYLYLTKKSGIQIRGKYDPLINRGISIPINNNISSDYKVMAMQVAIRYDQDFFPYSPTQIFEIESKSGTIKFFMVADSPNGKRAKIYAINANTGKLENNIGFYLNGNIVSNPVITTKQWSFLGISFSNLLNFNDFVGAFRITGPLLVNLISNYQSTNLKEVQNVTKRPWFKIKKSNAFDLDWNFWYPAYKWDGVLVLSSTSYYGADPSDIYKSYAGTNKIIVDDYSPNDIKPKILSFKTYEYNIYTDIIWKTITQNAV